MIFQGTVILRYSAATNYMNVHFPNIRMPRGTGANAPKPEYKVLRTGKTYPHGGTPSYDIVARTVVILLKANDDVKVGDIIEWDAGNLVAWSFCRRNSSTAFPA